METMDAMQTMKMEIEKLENSRIDYYVKSDNTLSVYVYSNDNEDEEDFDCVEFLEDNGINTKKLKYVDTEKGNFFGFDYRATYHFIGYDI